jgi:hypothetical protein
MAVIAIVVREVIREWVWEWELVWVWVIIWFRIGLPTGGRFNSSILTFDIHNEILQCLDCLFLLHCYFAGIGSLTDSFLQLSYNIWCHGIISNPSVFGCDTYRSQHTLGFCLALSLPYLKDLSEFDCKVTLTDQSLCNWWRSLRFHPPWLRTNRYLSRRGFGRGIFSTSRKELSVSLNRRQRREQRRERAFLNGDPPPRFLQGATGPRG